MSPVPARAAVVTLRSRCRDLLPGGPPRAYRLRRPCAAKAKAGANRRTRRRRKREEEEGGFASSFPRCRRRRPPPRRPRRRRQCRASCALAFASSRKNAFRLCADARRSRPGCISWRQQKKKSLSKTVLPTRHMGKSYPGYLKCSFSTMSPQSLPFVEHMCGASDVMPHPTITRANTQSP